MSHHPRLQEFQFDTKPSRSKPRRGINSYFYNSETGAVLGRTPDSWGKLVIFYLIFYGALVALFAICMVTFLQQYINPRVPRLQQDYGLIGTSPGLGFRPRPPDVRSTLIWYKGTGYESYKYWEDELIEFLLDYKKKGQTAGVGENIFDCEFGVPPPPGKVCDMKINLSPCIQENHFSYQRSTPCVFLKLNKIYGWRPEPFEPYDLPHDMPKDLRLQIMNITKINSKMGDMVWVSCHGETPADQENIGPLNYLPYPGFPGYFYPYMNAEGYLSPLVAVHFANPKPGIVINVECRAWARNIAYNRREKLGVVHFELMLE